MTDNDGADPAAIDYIGARTEGDVYRCTVERARSLLDAATCRILVAEDDRPVLRASAPPDPSGTGRSLPLPEGMIERAYFSDDGYVIDDLTDVRRSMIGSTSADRTAAYRSFLIVPNDTVGLIIAAGRRPASFTDDDIDLVARVLSYAEVALGRIHSQARRNARGERLAEIVSTFAHDLRSPLHAAAGHLSLARETGDDEYFERVTTAHDRIDELLDDMSRLARTGKRVDVRRTVDLQHVAEKAWTTAPTGDATLDIEGTRTFEADESRLCQALENLFQNAVDHGPPDTHVRVGTLDSGFYVEDDGPGIPAGDRDEVFEWRTSSNDGHSGLGLSIVEGIVEAHGWEISVSTSAMGGTRFEVAGVDFTE